MARALSDRIIRQGVPRSRDAHVIAALGVILLSCHVAALVLQPLQWIVLQTTKLFRYVVTTEQQRAPLQTTGGNETGLGKIASKDQQ